MSRRLNLRPKNQPEALRAPPLAVAAIDVGSSATRLVVARQGPRGQAPEALLRLRVPLRLGTEVFADGRIGPKSRAQLVQAFADIGQRLQAFGVTAYRAVATSALRDAVNGAEVLAEVARSTGIEVALISGEEEARLMRQALLGAHARHRQVPPPKDALLLDLGGGSLEVTRADGREARSLPLGTVRLLGQFPHLAQPMDTIDVVHMSEAFYRIVQNHVGAVSPAPMALGTGGNIEAMARGLPGERGAGMPSLQVEALLPAACSIGPLPQSTRARTFGLNPGRADLLLPAVLIVHAVALCYGVHAVGVPGGGIRDALLSELIEELEGG